MTYVLIMTNFFKGDYNYAAKTTIRMLTGLLLTVLPSGK